MAINNPYAAYQKFDLNPLKAKRVEREKKDVKPASAQTVISATYAQNSANKMTDQYVENTVMTATPEELTLMLYDGAIKFENKAAAYMETNEIEKAHNAIIRAQDIFTELMHTLNMDYDLSQNLHSLYDFIRSSLTQANVKKDAGLLKEMLSLTRELRDTWAEAMKLAKKEMQG